VGTGSERDASESRVDLALRGKIAQRELPEDEARQFDAIIAARIDRAVESADFSQA
jgi:hypothetical protein